MKIGIAIDKWKLAIFKRHLKGAGFEHTTNAGLTPEMLMLYVETNEVARLRTVIEAAQRECKSN